MLAHRVPHWVTIAVIASCGLVVAMQFTLVIPLLPDLPGLLDVSTADASWLVTATMLCSAVSTPIVARMADMYGKRRMLIISLAVMVAGSIVCALEVGFAMLIVGRAMQGFAASLIAVGISIMRDELPQQRVGAAIALMSATMGIGSSLGLPLSGAIYQTLGWHALFWFSAIAGTVLVVAIWLLIDESAVRTSGRFDIIGAILFSIALVCLLLPVSKGGQWGWSSGSVLGLFAAAAVAFAVWVPVQLRRRQPMVDLHIATQRTVLVTNIASLFIGFAMFANLLLTVQVLQLPTATGVGLGLDPDAGGLAMVPMGLAMVAMAPFTGRMLDRLGGRVTLMIGSSVMAVSYAARVFFSESLLQVIVGSTAVGIGTAIAFAAMPSIIMGAVPITETASANGLSTLVRSIGTSIASAVVAVILAASTVHVAGQALPSRLAVDIVLWLAAAVALVATAIGWAIPADRPRATALRGKSVAAGEQEAVVRGRVRFGDHTDVGKPAFVSVLTLDGEPVDWHRSDIDGKYAVALPGPGAYVFTVNAQGWSPTSRIVDYDGNGAGPELSLGEELVLCGQVRHAGAAAPRARVSVLNPEGDVVRSVTCDEDGWYRIPLPPPGPYVLTAVDPGTRRSTAHKLVVAVESARADLELVA